VFGISCPQQDLVLVKKDAIVTKKLYKHNCPMANMKVVLAVRLDQITNYFGDKAELWTVEKVDLR